MSEVMATTLVRFGSLLVIGGLVLLLAFAMNNGIEWLTALIATILCILGIGALFLVMYVREGQDG